MNYKRSIEDKFDLYDTIDACADAAAPIFQQQRWRWTKCGIPSRMHIISTLRYLKEAYETNEHNSPYVSTGRLICYQGRFGHQKDPRGNTPPATETEQ